MHPPFPISHILPPHVSSPSSQPGSSCFSHPEVAIAPTASGSQLCEGPGPKGFGDDRKSLSFICYPKDNTSRAGQPPPLLSTVLTFNIGYELKYYCGTSSQHLAWKPQCHQLSYHTAVLGIGSWSKSTVLNTFYGQVKLSCIAGAEMSHCCKISSVSAI